MFCNKLDNFVTIYIDDVLVFSYSIKKYEAHFGWFFNQLWKYFLKAKIKSIILVYKD